MLTLIIILLLVAFLKGCYDGFRDGLQGVNRFEIIEESLSIPYYIEEQIDAITTQIHASHLVIERIEEKLQYTSDIDKKAILEKKRANELYNVARKEEKLQKLLEKWE